MHYITKILLGKTDDLVHKEFTKYGKGEFDGPLIKGKIGKIVRLSSSFGYEGFIGELFSKHLPDDVYIVSGKIFTRTDLSDFLSKYNIPKMTKKDLLFTTTLNKLQLTNQQIKELYSTISEGNYLFLSYSPTNKANKTTLSTKKSFPKPKGEGDIKPDFCKGKIESNVQLLNDLMQELIPDFLDDVKELKDFTLSNKILITKLELPEGFKGKNPRLAALRIGKLIRTLTIDNKKIVKELNFKV